MRYETLEKCECLNGLNIGASLWVCGCSLQCKGCHNSNLWSFDGGEEYTQETECQILELIKPDYISRISILGGEPLMPQNYSDLARLIKKVKSAKESIKIWLYTGHTYESVKERAKESVQLRYILENIDYLIDGPFIQEQKDITLAFRGSRNQRILHNVNGEYVDETETFDNETA